MTKPEIDGAQGLHFAAAIAIRRPVTITELRKATGAPAFERVIIEDDADVFVVAAP